MDDDTKYKLANIAIQLIEDGKGLLASDESPDSIETRLKKNGLENNKKNREIFRKSVFQTKDLEKYVGGVILHEETFTMVDENNEKIVKILSNKGINLGLKVDEGLAEFQNEEKITLGIEKLDEKLSKCSFIGDVQFTKWRSVFTISRNTPTDKCIEQNCDLMARYAKIVQKHKLVPILEPEMLWLNGDYSISECNFYMTKILSTLVSSLNNFDVYLPGLLIKTVFVSNGQNYKGDEKNDVGLATYDTLMKTIPCAIPGIVFLSGGHSSEEAIRYLSDMAAQKGERTWKLSFSFCRAFTDPFLEAWKGKNENLENAQSILLKKVEQCKKINEIVR